MPDFLTFTVILFFQETFLMTPLFSFVFFFLCFFSKLPYDIALTRLPFPLICTSFKWQACLAPATVVLLSVYLEQLYFTVVSVLSQLLKMFGSHLGSRPPLLLILGLGFMTDLFPISGVLELPV